MSSAQAPLVIGFGEFLWDVLPTGRVPGGAPGNFAFQAGQLGCRGMVISSVGADADGDELVRFLQDRGIETAGIQRDPEHPTSRVTVTLSGDGIPAYTIHEDVAWDYIRMEPVLQQAMREAAAVCFGTLSQRCDVTRETLHRSLELTSENCLRVYDVNLRQQYYQKEWITASAAQAEIIKLNDDEVALLAPLLNMPTDPVEFGRTMIDSFGVNIVCMTRGSRGCLVVTADEVHDIPGRAVKVADTVGAGDAFTAGLVVSQLRGWPLSLSCEFANRVGGLVASRKGGMPELRDDFAQLLEQYS